MQKITPVATFVVLVALLIAQCAEPKPLPSIPDPVAQTVGPSSEEIQNLQDRLEEHPEFRKIFQDNRYRILSFKPVFSDAKEWEGQDTLIISRYTAIAYDYTRDQAYEIRLSTDTRQVEATAIDDQPTPNAEEEQLAYDALIRNLNISDQVTAGTLTVVNAMPPAMSNSEGNRMLSFMVIGPETSDQLGAYAVNISDERHPIEVMNHNFAGLEFSAPTCGPPDLDSGSDPTGYKEITIPNPFNPLTPIWKFTVVQPKSSSGHKGSGVELRDVSFMGKSVLKRAHAPKLNVIYDAICGGNAQSYCGGSSVNVYDDPIFVPAKFEAQGTNFPPVANGFRNCTAMPQTIVDSGDDGGNFKGVAIYKNPTDNSVVVVSELQADWYRYAHEWVFYPSGRIEPRFKFSAVQNNCTCERHVHHVYWRFDFDINGSINSVIESYVPTKGTGSNWVSVPPFTQEVTRYRSYSQMMWTISGPNNLRCDLIAGEHDGNGNGDDWAKGDVFIAKYDPDEINEWGLNTSNQLACFNDAHLIDGENINGEDIVIWYRAGSLHDESAIDPSGQHQIVGPSIKCRWNPGPYEDEYDDQIYN
ncbi:hypothetical protein [Flavilitoribacter nigricans]|uniref:Copper amine oxidase catalytic domain-containing protein n=1 Tax=Flavilitoribacter nigricans (strain ATCC 23147 / DSM 23189 / NBRC 102662 / NCIMB 1420 / SS-2) TaxID=1122177 RepID=A0A2D0NH54_FLAN2|nr:hypothetical protein [Flavilitoribacter nigricans]PHN07821.1 hypothetical protein CRP01_04680 [Flavilitoribacter nigricans DSM 23189 = NBRC 102662]